MAENTRATRSTRGRGNDDAQTDAQFWNSVPDPREIVRGRTEAIDMAYAAAANFTRDDTSNQQEPATEIGNINEVTNYTASMIPQATAPLTYMNEEEYEGLEEQFLTEDEVTDDEVPVGEVADITANRVVTPQGMQTSNGPLNPMYTQQTTGGQLDLDTQPSKGPKNPNVSLGEVLNAYMDDDYTDILRTSQLKTSFSLMSLNNTAASRPQMPLEWIVPDGTNRTLEEIAEKKIANGTSPGGGSGAVVVSLPQLEKYFTTKYYLVDLDTGEVFAYTGQLWRRTGLYCAVQPFNVAELRLKMERYSRAMKMEIENEEQTPITPLTTSRPQSYIPTPLPPMDDPEIYVVHQDVMTTHTRRNYTRDRMRAAITYINEYYDTQNAITQDNTHREALETRLRIIYGRINNTKQRVDEALLADDAFRRRRNMRDVPGVTRFPTPQMMSQASSTAWVTWIREETNIAMIMLDEEVTREGDPEDPFNGTAGGVFELPPGRTNSLSLPPPVHTPADRKRTDGGQGTNGGDEHSTPSRLIGNPNQLELQKAEKGNGGDEHSTPSLDPNHTIRRLHTQQREQRAQHEAASPADTTNSQDRNLITFTPTPPESASREIPTAQERGTEPNAGGQQVGMPMPQRQSTRNRDSSTTDPPEQPPLTGQEILRPTQTSEHAAARTVTNPPVTEENEFPLEQQESYLRLPVPQENSITRKCWRCGEEGHSKKGCNKQVSCTFCQVYSHATRACKKYASFVRNSQGTSSKRTTPIQGSQPGVRMQGPPVQGPRYGMNHYTRFQPPVVPPMMRPPAMTQMIQPPSYPISSSQQTLHRSVQDVRDDPNYVNQEARTDGVNGHPQGISQGGTVYVKCPIPIENTGPTATATTTAPKVQPTQEQQQIPQSEDPQALQTKQRQLYAKIKQQQELLKQMQQQNRKLQQQQWQRQIAELQKSGIPEQKKAAQPSLPRIVEGVLQPKKEQMSFRNDTTQLVNEVDRPVFVNHYYAALAEKAVRIKHQGKILYVIEGDEHSSLSSKSVQVETPFPLTQSRQKEGDEYSTPSPKTMETGLNRMTKVEQQAPYGTSEAYAQHTKNVCTNTKNSGCTASCG